MTQQTLRSSILHSPSSILVLVLLLLPGCQLIGVGAQALPPATIVPQYKKLAGESVGVMVWADRGMRIEWPGLQLDLANTVQAKLDSVANPPGRAGREKPRAKVKELQGTTFPLQPESVVRFQQDHPEIDGQPIDEVAPRLGVSRLIYIEIEDFATRPDGGVELFRGDATVTLRVVEVAPDGTAEVAYVENDVRATFPPNAPREGRPSIGDRRIYIGLINALGDAIAKKFVPHPEED